MAAITICIACQAALSMGILQARILEWVAMFLLQGIFLSQGSNPGLLHCRQIHYCLSHQGSLKAIILQLKREREREPARQSPQ